MNEIIYLKKDEMDTVLDKVSLSDYFAVSALLVIKEAEGPNLLRDIRFGRQDAKSEREAGDPSQIPTA